VVSACKEYRLKIQREAESVVAELLDLLARRLLPDIDAQIAGGKSCYVVFFARVSYLGFDYGSALGWS
jgi:hypothetical protein